MSRRAPHRRDPWRLVRAVVVVACAVALAGPLPAAASSRGQAGVAGSCTAPQQQLGLDAYRYVDQLSSLDLGSRAASVTTADPGGSNDDRSHLLTDGEGRQLLMDAAGPGLVTFLRMQEAWGGPWELDVDGRTTRVDVSELGQEPTDARFPFPLALNPQQSQGSSIIATPLAFTSSFRYGASGHNGNFYALYRKLPLGGVLPTPSTDTRDVAALLRASPQVLPEADLRRTAGTSTLTAGDTTIAMLSGGPRQLRELTFQVPSADAVAFANQRLRIYWDGETTPSVDAPIKYLAGAGGGVYSPASRPLVQSFMTSTRPVAGGRTEFAMQWPMPFASSARVVISSTTPIPTVDWRVAEQPFASPAGGWGTFHANFTQIDHPTPGEDLTFLDVGGSGRIVGTVVNFGRVGETLEGDPHVYLDGSRTPQVTLTGTEEWGLGGNYWRYGQQTSLPLGGFPTGDHNPTGTDVDGAALYRYLLADSIPFNSRAVVRWEHGGVDDVAQPYRAVVLWYGTDRVTARTTDVLRPADSTSARTHGLEAAGALRNEVTGGFGYSVSSQPTTATGLRTARPLQFTLKVDPRNTGVLLRRQLDTAVADQRARVFVDGQPAGVWYNPGSYSDRGVDGTVRRWMDDEVLLAARLTAGKSTVTVRVVPEATRDRGAGWTAFEIRAMSMVPVCA